MENFNHDKTKKKKTDENAGLMSRDVRAFPVSKHKDAARAVAEVHISAREFETKMKELLPDVSCEKAIKTLI